MPRLPNATGPIAPAKPDDDKVTAVTRSLALLDAFGVADAQLQLTELARRTAIPKPTVLRLARTLAHSGYLVALPGGAWRLGPAAARLGARYQRGFDLRNLIEPTLQQVADRTGHSASFFAMENQQRVRLMRVLGADGFVSPTRVGEPLPLDKGAAGQVILAFSGGTDADLVAIRERGFHITAGEAATGFASLAAPVSVDRGQVGALSIVAPDNAAAIKELGRHTEVVVEAARRLSQAFAAADLKSRGDPPLQGTWYPR